MSLLRTLDYDVGIEYISNGLLILFLPITHFCFYLLHIREHCKINF